MASSSIPIGVGTGAKGEGEVRRMGAAASCACRQGAPTRPQAKAKAKYLGKFIKKMPWSRPGMVVPSDLSGQHVSRPLSGLEQNRNSCWGKSGILSVKVFRCLNRAWSQARRRPERRPTESLTPCSTRPPLPVIAEGLKNGSWRIASPPRYSNPFLPLLMPVKWIPKQRPTACR